MLRHALSVTGCLLALCTATPALASSLTLEQQSASDMIGEWTLTTPSGLTIASHDKEQVRSINNAPIGTYTLHVSAPASATTTIRVRQGNVVQSAVTAKSMTFTLKTDASLRVEMVYTFQGAVTVESMPSGARFELMGPHDMRIAGTTPMTVSELPPFTYMVNFGLREGCSLPRPIERELREREHIRFLGEYRCGMTSSASSISSSVSSSPSVAARIIQSLQTPESTAGGTVMITTGIVNSGTSTLHDITFTEQFDPSAVAIPEVPAGAMVQGNLIIWRIPSIYAGQRWSANVRLLLLPSLKAGTKTALTARVSTEDLINQDPQTLAATVQIGVAALPKTGWAMDTILILLGLPTAWAMTKSTKLLS